MIKVGGVETLYFCLNIYYHATKLYTVFTFIIYVQVWKFFLTITLFIQWCSKCKCTGESSLEILLPNVFERFVIKSLKSVVAVSVLFHLRNSTVNNSPLFDTTSRKCGCGKTWLSSMKVQLKCNTLSFPINNYVITMYTAFPVCI